MTTSWTIQFLPSGAVVRGGGPEALADLAADAGMVLDQPCGGLATCAKCRARFIEGAPEATETERRLLDPEEINQGWRLSCQCLVAASAVAEIPSESVLISAKSFGPEDLRDGNAVPQVERRHVTLSEENCDDQHALLDALRHGLGLSWPIETEPQTLRAIPWESWDERRALTADLDGELLIGLHSGHLRDSPLGVAVDLGSTTVAAALIDLRSGHVLATADALNPQVSHGADVMSRIEFANANHGGNATLHRLAREVVAGLIRGLAESHGTDPSEIISMTLAGNSTMLHTFVGAEVCSLGHVPYVGLWTRALTMSGEEAGLPIHPAARLRLFPMIRSHVGGDTSSAVVAAGLDQTKDLTLLIDMGTNSEIVLGNCEEAICTSAAAGPAFEGAAIHHGMRAAPGAIDRISLSPQGSLRVHVIGGGPARGLCGTGLIDAVAALRRAGVIDASGRMIRGAEWDRIGDTDMRGRLIEHEPGRPAVVLAHAKGANEGKPVILTDRDVRQLQLVKGSIMAGAEILLRRLNREWSDVKRVCVAGAFGAHVRKSSALAIGLLPPVDPERVEMIGNAAGVGARLALIDRSAWQRATAFAERCDYLELGFLPEYQQAFAEAMRFPEGNAGDV